MARFKGHKRPKLYTFFTLHLSLVVQASCLWHHPQLHSGGRETQRGQKSPPRSLHRTDTNDVFNDITGEKLMQEKREKCVSVFSHPFFAGG